jgi:hypothetical protein
MRPRSPRSFESVEFVRVSNLNEIGPNNEGTVSCGLDLLLPPCNIQGRGASIKSEARNCAVISSAIATEMRGSSMLQASCKNGASCCLLVALHAWGI